MSTQSSLYKKKTLYIAVTQSGETKDTLDAAKMIKSYGCNIWALTNVDNSTITGHKYSDGKVLLDCGAEIGVASTKTTMRTVERLYNIFCMAYDVHKINEALEKTWNVKWTIKSHAKNLSEYNNFLFLGTKHLHSVALEGALKMKEVAYVHAEGMPSAEMKHGPIALIDKTVPSIFLCSEDNLENSQILNNISEIESRGGQTIVFTERPEKVKAKTIIMLPKTDRHIQPLVFLMAVQLFAYYSAVARGKNVDRPRNLAKTVSV